MVIVVCGLAVEALQTFVEIDLARRFNGADRALGFANPAFGAAGRATFKPIKHVHPA